MQMKREPKKRRSATELNALLRFTVGMVLAGCLAFTIASVLYGLLFVSQPMQQSPNDEAFISLLEPISTFLVGTLSGVMIASGVRGDRDGDGIPDKEAE
jgi:hypothetical protein